MNLLDIICLVLCIASLTALAIMTRVCTNAYKQIKQLKVQNETYKRHNRYQQKQIESLREHNGNLFDENMDLKCTLAMNNIPDFSKKW